MMTKNDDLKKFSEFEIPTYDEWRAATEKSLRGKSFDTLLTKLLDDVVLEPMYQQKDIADNTIKAEQPGQYPFTRGISDQATPWKVSQELSGQTPKLLNEAMKNDLARGQNVYHIVLNENVKKGLLTENDAGAKRGVPIFDQDDVKEMFADFDIAALPLHMDTGEVSLPLLAAIKSLAGEKEITGIIAADPIHQLAKEGKLTYSLDQAYDHLATAVKWASEEAPLLQTVLVQTHAYHNGGASPSVEVASALSTGVAYVQALIDRGVSASDAGKAIAFTFSIGSDYFSELSKIRAARTLWAAVMKEFGADEEAQKMYIHARTSFFTKATEDMYVNILRGTSEAFSAAAAGVNSLHVSALDEVVQEPTPFTRRIARNTSLILQEESYIDRTVDPAGGSWYVEHLTDELAKKAWDYFQKIEEAGGIIASLKEGQIQGWIEKAWSSRLTEVERRKRVIVGVNQYVNLDETFELADRSAQNEASEKYAASVKEKSEKQWNQLSAPGSVAEIKALAEQHVPFHVIHQLLGATENEELSVAKVEQRRLAEPFEQLRRQSDEIAAETGERPTVYLLGVGVLADYKARADFITGFFQSGGFSVVIGEGEQGLKEAAGQKLVVLCGKDSDYEEQAAHIAKTLKEQNSEGKRFIAGQQPKEQADELVQAGINDFIHLKTNVYTFLYDLQEWMKGGGKNE